MSYYDIPERPLEPPYYEPVDYCHLCGNDIFNGEEIYEIEGDWYCEDCIYNGYKLPYIPRKNTPVGNCAECSESLYNDQETYKLNDNLYCEECIDNLHTEAYERGNPFESI